MQNCAQIRDGFAQSLRAVTGEYLRVVAFQSLDVQSVYHLVLQGATIVKTINGTRNM